MTAQERLTRKLCRAPTAQELAEYKARRKAKRAAARATEEAAAPSDEPPKKRRRKTSAAAQPARASVEAPAAPGAPPQQPAAPVAPQQPAAPVVPQPVAPPRRRPTGPDASRGRGTAKTSSRFVGVRWHTRNGRWEAQYTDANGEKVHVGYFDDEEKAALAYNDAVEKSGVKRPLNEIDAARRPVPKPDMASRYWSVALTRGERWKAEIRRPKSLGFDGKKFYVGTYDDDRDAALMADAYARLAMPSLAEKCNFKTLATTTLPKPYKIVLGDVVGYVTKFKVDAAGASFRVDLTSVPKALRRGRFGKKKRVWSAIHGDARFDGRRLLRPMDKVA